MTSLNKVVASLRAEYSRLQHETERVGKALIALGNLNGTKLKRGKRVLRRKLGSESPRHKGNAGLKCGNKPS